MGRQLKYSIHKVLISPKLEGKAGREHLNGIFRFLDASHVWDVRIIRAQKELTTHSIKEALHNGIDGFILSIPSISRMRREINLIAKSSKPAVILDNYDTKIPNGNFSFIRLDQNAIISAGLSYLEKNFPNASLGFVHDVSGEAWSTSRLAAFKTLTKNTKCKRFIFKGKKTSQLAEWLKPLPPLTALITANDLTGLSVVETCKEIGISVPNKIAVLGIDNDELICGHCRPSLATIEPNFMGVGYLAAETLQKMMTGHQVATIKIPSYSVNRIITRDSSRPQIKQVAILDHVLTHIRDHIATANVDSVTRALGITRSQLYQAFKSHPRTFANEVQNARFEYALELLKDPNQAISPIASLCGWSSDTYLMHLFKRRMGVSMNKWRANYLSANQ